ncbi:unannotated protein [freshwater metagenome]|uniref:Unannotated protein n=1 Tax=freshwater metagenome TaxID=449393 RepID=A0A6J6C731_9ZZZZ
MSLTRVDFPEPETPVTDTKRPNGISTSISFRLFSFAPLMTSFRFGSTGRRCEGISIDLRPDRYAPVIDSSDAMSSSYEPETTTLPPCSPAPGPISTTQSAVRIVSSSCSTTINVFPKLRSLVKVSISRRLSLWWRPILGSSRT